MWLNAGKRHQFRYRRNANSYEGAVSINDDYAWAREVDEYAALLAVMVLKAEQDASNTRFELETDVLTGWCRRDPGTYGEILLTRDIPIEDIVFAAPYFHVPRSRGLEVDEWLVANREPTGSMTFDAMLCLLPVEVRCAFEERAFKTPWHTLRDWSLSGIEERHRRLRMPSLVPRFQSPWYVRWANAIARL